MRRLFFIFVAAMGAFVANPARAAQMPVYFVGDWCFDYQEGQSVWFLLPSWTEKGSCPKILSITDYGFSGAGHHCDPIQARLSSETAPSGTAYTAMIVARCEPDGPPSASTIRTIEFRRYKGSLQVTKIKSTP
jgi:hypothetical protein